VRSRFTCLAKRTSSIGLRAMVPVFLAARHIGSMNIESVATAEPGI
jgi:hypothetical protein